MKSFREATARERIKALLDSGTFKEFIPPEKRVSSPHLSILDVPVSFDDGAIVGKGEIDGMKVLIAAEEGRFIGGAVGEVHGAKFVGLLRKAIQDRPEAVVLLLESGGVRLHEANAGLIAVSEVMRAVLDCREAHIPVVVAIGGSNGCYGGMSLVAASANTIIMSEEGRLALSGPEVIETSRGVEEFDSRDRALVFRTMGGKHRFLTGDCDYIVKDDIEAFKQTIVKAIKAVRAKGTKLNLAELEAQQVIWESRLKQFKDARDAKEIWEKLGMKDPENIPLLPIDTFLQDAVKCRVGGD